MSGLRNSTDRYEFLNFSKGKIVHNGKEFNEFEGRVIDIKLTEDEYNGDHFKKVGLLMRDDEGQLYLLNFRLDSGYGITFCMLVPNIDWLRAIIISGSQKEVDGKKKSSVFVKQRGAFIKWHFTKENPGELPPLEKVKYKGQDVWDSSKQQTYFINMLNVISEELTKVKNPVTSSNEPPEIQTALVPMEQQSPIPDDLPF